MAKPLCVQINWQRQLGGGEVYTRFFSAALIALGWDVQLIAEHQAAFWSELDMEGVKILPIKHGKEILDVLPKKPVVVVTHTTLPAELASAVAERHRLGGLIHMPLLDRNPGGLAYYHLILAVSDYVAASAQARGYEHIHDEALLGVADLRSRTLAVESLSKRSEYDWDKRKFRDRLLSWLEPFVPKQNMEFVRHPTLTLGIVSRLTPIKQFPVLFSLIAPIIAEHPDVNLEIFGSGGYASIRDLREALSPLGSRVRWWGHQPNPAAIYPQLDYLLSGLPEREALGLNLIEAQAAGTPVLAIDAPPFTETVISGVSGHLYRDPRLDGGASFRSLLAELVSCKTRLDPRGAVDHLARFSEASFVARVNTAMTVLSG